MPTIFIGIDGLVKIAEANGVLGLTTATGDGADGPAATCILHFSDADHAYTATMAEATRGRRPTGVWLTYPHQMLRAFTIRKAITTHFKDAVEAAEKKILR